MNKYAESATGTSDDDCCTPWLIGRVEVSAQYMDTSGSGDFYGIIGGFSVQVRRS
ncbi:hypothetical protein [Spirosoma flavum]|uniref:Uncharacterized protein n=1 Tax=Spirosoma flavum TaxID=2048557 RepID=A0ABW6ATP7_9BACT